MRKPRKDQKNFEEIEPAIRLEIFRHDEKDQAEHDHIAPLTEKGRQNALASGRGKNPSLNQGYVMASPRERALHSAILQFFGPQFEDLALDKRTLQEVLEQLGKKKMRHNSSGKLMRIDHKIKTDERLNFHVESHSEFNESFYREYNKKEGNRTLDFQLYDSDQLILDLAQKAEKADDKNTLGLMRVKGFKRMVGDLAEVISDYFRKFSFWKKSYQQNPSDYDSNEMQIFIGTHSQNIECFVMKIIQMKLGIKALEDFLEKLDHRKSFIGYSEGFTIIIVPKNGVLIAKLQFKNYQFDLSKKDLAQIIAERDQFNQEVKEKIKISKR